MLIETPIYTFNVSDGNNYRLKKKSYLIYYRHGFNDVKISIPNSKDISISIELFCKINNLDYKEYTRNLFYNDEDGDRSSDTLTTYYINNKEASQFWYLDYYLTTVNYIKRNNYVV